MAARPDIDLTWKPLAESTRQALDLLGYPLPACLPDEPEPCGGSFAEHTLAHLAALRAVVEYRITHLHLDDASLLEQIHDETLAKLRAAEPCDQGHQQRAGEKF
jgi:hypothetical protein